MTSTAAQPAIRTAQLSNGVSIVTERMPHVRSVAVGIWVSTGSRRETPEQNGISHFIEHMLFKGTTSRSAEEIAKSVDSIGGNLDAFTSRELVSFNTKVLGEHLPMAFDVLSDLVLNPQFRPADVEKEKGVILEEIKMDADSPESVAHEIFCRNFWKGHALGKPILGTKESIASFDSNTLRSYYERAYTPENIVITGAGNLDHDRLVDLCAKAFEGVQRDGRLPESATPDSHAEISLKSKRTLEQTHMCMGVPAYPMPHKMRFACYLLSAILGGGMSSRLFQNIREKQGLVYAVFSELNLYRDAGVLEIYAGFSPQSTRKVIDSIMAEFSQLKGEPVAAEELRRAKDHLKGSLMLSLESTSSRMANLARQHIFFNRFFSLDELLASIEGVSAEQVHQVANEFFDPQRIALTLLGPLKGFQLTRADLAC